MSSGALRFWGCLAAEAALAALVLVFAGVSAPPAALPSEVGVVLGAITGALLLSLVARPRLPLPRLRPKRAGILVVKGIVLLVGSISEEILWRWLAIGALAPAVGAVPAYLASTAAFAASHRGRRARLVHLVTGAGFGGVFLLTGSLASCIVAHATYNLLVMLAREPPIHLAAMRRTRRTATTGRLDAAVPVQLRDVVKRFGAREALRGVSLELRPGELVALLGPNGSGKTTTLRILLGLRRPDAGYAFLLGRDPRHPATRVAVGVTQQESGFPPTATVREIVDFVRAHYPAPRSAAELLERFGLTGLERRQTGSLSGGQRRRLAVALAFAGDPRVVVLDEPTTGLDLAARRGVWDAIRGFAGEGGTVLLTTHYLEEAEALARRVAVISAGRVVRDAGVQEIKAAAGLKRVRLTAVALPELPAAESVVRKADVWTIYTRDAEVLVRSLVSREIPLHDLEIAPVSLEEAFLRLTEEAP